MITSSNMMGDFVLKHHKKQLAGYFLLSMIVLPLFQSCSKDSNDVYESTTYYSNRQSSSSAVYSLTDGSIASVSGKTYAATAIDQSAILVTNGSLTVANCTVTKTGDASDAEETSSLYGTNAAVLAYGSTSTITILGGNIITNAAGANAVFTYSGKITISNDTISTTGNYSSGILAVSGGTIVASNLIVSTSGTYSPAIATEGRNGTITVAGGTYKTTGADAAVINSNGIISASGITGTSTNAEAAVINGANYIILTDSSTLTTGSSDRGVLFVKNSSGSASGSAGYFTMTGGSFTTTNSAAPLFEVVTNSTANITLTGVTVSSASGILMKVDYNTEWKTYGAIGNLIISGAKTVSGNVEADATSIATVTVNTGSTWSGAFDTDNIAKSGTVTVNGGTWNLTGNSYIDTLTLTNNAIVNKNGYTLTVTTTNNSSGTINN